MPCPPRSTQVRPAGAAAIHRTRFTITLPADTTLAAPALPQPRAIGRGEIRCKARDGASVISGLKTSGSMKLLFPRVDEPAMTVVTLNTAGGLTGGDQMDLIAVAQTGSHMRLTTQAAERVYRAQPGEIAEVRTELTVDAGARLDWLPQETILYDQGALTRRLTAHVAADARLLVVEPLIFGRAAMGEVLSQIALQDHLRLYRDGQLVFADGLRLNGDLQAQAKRMAIGAGAGAMLSATLLSDPGECEALLDQLRPILPDSAGVTLVQPGVLFLRALAADSFELRRGLIPALTLMNGAALPRTWMI